MSKIVVEKFRRVTSSFKPAEDVAGGQAIQVAAEDGGGVARISDKFGGGIHVDVADLEDLRQAIYAVQVELAHWKQADG